jgi:hypothetical protein
MWGCVLKDDKLVMGLLCRAGIFRLLLMGLGNFARNEENNHEKT